MLTGRVLFSGNTTDEVLTKHLIDGPDLDTDWPPARVPAGLTEVIARALSRNPEDRYDEMRLRRPQRLEARHVT